MKKGYHDYVPVVKEEKKEIVKEIVENTHEPKYVTSNGGLRHKISDERGMVVASTDILMFGWRAPSLSYGRIVSPDLKMDTKSYIKYNGRL